MRLRDLTPILWTRDVKATTDYYTNVLGFKLDHVNEETGSAHVSKHEVQLMFSLPKTQYIPFDEPKFTGSLYIFVNGVDSMWEEIKDKVNVCYPIEDFDYGMREFGIYDNNGYLLRFGQEISD